MTTVEQELHCSTCELVGYKLACNLDNVASTFSLTCSKNICCDLTHILNLYKKKIINQIHFSIIKLQL